MSAIEETRRKKEAGRELGKNREKRHRNQIKKRWQMSMLQSFLLFCFVRFTQGKYKVKFHLPLVFLAHSVHDSLKRC